MNTISGNQTEVLRAHAQTGETLNAGYFSVRSWWEWVFALAVIAGGLWSLIPLWREHGCLRKGHFAGCHAGGNLRSAGFGGPCRV